MRAVPLLSLYQVTPTEYSNLQELTSKCEKLLTIKRSGELTGVPITESKSPSIIFLTTRKQGRIVADLMKKLSAEGIDCKQLSPPQWSGESFNARRTAIYKASIVIAQFGAGLEDSNFFALLFFAIDLDIPVLFLNIILSTREVSSSYQTAEWFLKIAQRDPERYFNYANRDRSEEELWNRMKNFISKVKKVLNKKGATQIFCYFQLNFFANFSLVQR